MSTLKSPNQRGNARSPSNAQAPPARVLCAASPFSGPVIVSGTTTSPQTQIPTLNLITTRSDPPGGGVSTVNTSAIASTSVAMNEDVVAAGPTNSTSSSEGSRAAITRCQRNESTIPSHQVQSSASRGFVTILMQ